MDNLITAPTPEELAEESAAAQLPKEEEVRQSIIDEFQFDPETDKDRIDKMVTKELEGRKKLSKAIGQKVTARTNFETLKKTMKPGEVTGDPVVPLEKKSDLSSADVLTFVSAGITDNDDIGEVVKASKLLGKTISDTLKDPMIQGILSTRKAERVTAEATITRGGARGTSEASGEELLSRARTEQVEGTPENMRKIFAQRQQHLLDKRPTRK